MSYRDDLWEVAATNHGVVTLSRAEDAGVPAVEVRKLASRGALEGYGNGVYRHLTIPPGRLTQEALAVALCGEGAFLHAESVVHLHQLGNLNPRRIRVSTTKRVRRTLPDWLELTVDKDQAPENVTSYEGIPSQTLGAALRAVKDRVEPTHLRRIIQQAVNRELISDVSELIAGKET